MKAILQRNLLILKQTDLDLYEQICSTLIILHKHTQLNILRQLYQLQQADHENLEISQMLDRISKTQIYGQNIDDPLSILDQLSEKTLAKMARFTMPELLINLKKEQAKVYKINQAWEENLSKQLTTHKESWKRYLFKKVKGTVQAVYQYSLIGLGGELMGWLGKIVGLGNSLRPLGEALGAELSILSGWFAFSKSILIALAGQTLHRYFCKSSFDDQNARIKTYHGYLPGALGFTRILSFFSAALSSVYQARWIPFIQGLTSLLGSTTTVAVAQSIFPVLRAKAPTENQTYTLALLALGGAEAGNFFAQTGMQLFDKHTRCHTFAEAFSRTPFFGVLTQQAHCPDLVQASHLWLNDENPVRIEWLDTRQTFFQAECHLVQAALDHPNVTVYCDRPDQISLNAAVLGWRK